MRTLNRQARILLVEDNRMDVELTLDAFKEARLSNAVHVASTGEQALEYMRGENQYADRQTHPLPDLILLDLKLPGVGGHEVLRQIKSEPELKRIPIIVLTSSLEESDRIKSYDYGVNSFLVKPVSFDGFLEVIKEINVYWLTLNVRPMD